MVVLGSVAILAQVYSCKESPKLAVTAFPVRMAIMANKAALLYSMRDDMLEVLTNASGTTQQGVAQAARTCKNGGVLGKASCSKLVDIDFA